MPMLKTHIEVTRGDPSLIGSTLGFGWVLRLGDGGPYAANDDASKRTDDIQFAHVYDLQHDAVTVAKGLGGYTVVYGVSGYGKGQDPDRLAFVTPVRYEPLWTTRG